MDILNPSIEGYIAGLRNTPDPVLEEMERIAREKNFPIVGPEVGRLLYIFARAAGARRILELGSGYGYSAAWFAKALPEGGIVHCTDGSADNRDKALDYLTRMGLGKKIRFHVGSALKILEELEGSFDIVFNDIDKEDYPATVDKVLPRLVPGGLYITDNALWYGKVLQDPPHDAATQGVVAFNRRLASHPDLETIIVPIRDGLAVSVKK